MHAGMYACMYVNTCIYTGVYTYIYIYIYMYTYIYIYIYTHTHASLSLCKYTHIHTYWWLGRESICKSPTGKSASISVHVMHAGERGEAA